MSKKANLFIEIITEMNNKGLNQAKGGLLSLDNLATKLGKAIGGAFAADKVIAFGKASVEAFMADQKALALLDQTLKDVGLGFDSVMANDFIAKLSEMYGITKEQLIPAFQTLIRYTGDFAKTQELTQLALDISAGTGKDLASVTTALGKAYGGNATALGRLGTGLSNAVLTSKNFALIQKQLTAIFKGDASVAAETYQGKVNRLKIAFHDMQVQIGEGLVTAFTNLAGSGGSLNMATDAMKNLGDQVKYALDEITFLIAKMEKIPGVGNALKQLSKDPLMAIPVVGTYLSAFAAQGKKRAEALSPSQAIGKEREYQAQLALNAKAQAAADARRIADAKALAKSKADQLALEKATLALKRDSKVVDLAAIENYAALAQAQSQDDKNRLMLMQALLDQNATAATNLANKVLAANGLVMDLQGNVTKDPFAAWAQSLENFNADLEAGLVTAQKLLTLTTGLGAGNPTAGTSINAAGQAGFAADFAASLDYSAAASTASNQPIVINNNYAVNAAGMVGTAADFAAAINYSIVDTSGSGVATSLSRVNSSLLGPKIG